MNRYFEDFNYRIKSIKNLKIIVFTIILFNIFIGSGIYTPTPVTYFNNLLINITNPAYNVFVFSVLIYVAINSMHNFENYLPFVGRYETREQYLEDLIKHILFDVIFVFILNITIIMLILKLFFNGTLGIENYANYTISDLVYFTFYMFRFFAIFILSVIIFTLISKLFNKLIGMIYNIFIVMLFFINFPITIINHLSIDVFLIYIYTSIITYPSFVTEICYSSLFILCLMTIIFSLSFFLKKKQIDIG